MSDYSSVAPPQTQQNFSQTSAFAAALQRAKQVRKLRPFFSRSLCAIPIRPGFHYTRRRFHLPPTLLHIREICIFIIPSYTIVTGFVI